MRDNRMVGSEEAAPMHSNASQARQSTCLTCGEVYVKRKPWQAFCSNGCRNKHHHAKRTVEALAKRVESLEEQMAMIRRHLVL